MLRDIGLLTSAVSDASAPILITSHTIGNNGLSHGWAPVRSMRAGPAVLGLAESANYEFKNSFQAKFESLY